MDCHLCKQEISETMEVHLFINGQATNLTGNIHAVNGHPAHPESLRGVGGPLVSETDIWEWRVLTPYEQGKFDGRWTRERLEESGFESVQACLAHHEQSYAETVARLRGSDNLDEAARQIEYWNGLISAVRESLGALMVQEA